MANVHNLSLCIAMLGAALAIYGSIEYVRSILAGDTKPLRVTWGGWTLVGVLGLVSSLQGGAGIGLIATLPFVALVALVFILSLNPKFGKPGGSRLDYTVGIISGVVLITQLFVKYSPAVGATVAVLADMVFLWPTVREAWRQPKLEALRPWIIGAMAETLGIVALGNYSYASAAYPVYVLFGNLAIIYALVVRKARPKRQPRRRAIR